MGAPPPARSAPRSAGMEVGPTESEMFHFCDVGSDLAFFDPAMDMLHVEAAQEFVFSLFGN